MKYIDTVRPSTFAQKQLLYSQKTAISSDTAETLLGSVFSFPVKKVSKKIVLFYFFEILAIIAIFVLVQAVNISKFLLR